ncbi:MAG: ATP-binding protein [Clostridiaceae bacterium]
MHKFKKYRYGLSSLVIFRSLLEEPVIKALQELLESDKGDVQGIRAYGAFASELYKEGADFSGLLLRFILEDENFYIKAKARNQKITEAVEQCLMEELKFLQELSQLSSSRIKEIMSYEGYLPDWYNTDYDFLKEYKDKIDKVAFEGYGIYSKYYAFNFKAGEIKPVKNIEPIFCKDLQGYERERTLVMENTKALIEGKPANNVLLYGDAGTGKSTTIKAVLNELKDQGLRLVEVKKQQLFEIPELMDKLADIPLKFIIFIDDLSFTGNDDTFSSLKAVLEGGISALGKNTVIYATSNRRHLMKETLGDRNGDELHLNDTLQESMSLASRFGLTITFVKPDKEAYLSIVKKLAEEYELSIPEEELILKAEAHAIRCSGRSARTARQFVELMKSEVEV